MNHIEQLQQLISRPEPKPIIDLDTWEGTGVPEPKLYLMAKVTSGDGLTGYIVDGRWCHYEEAWFYRHSAEPRCCYIEDGLTITK